MAVLSVRSFSRISKRTLVTLLLVAVALLNSNTVESPRNMNITADSGNFPNNILGVWNHSFKSVENCSRFHDENSSDYFFFWPEPDFKFCCGRVGNYTYTTYGPPLQLTSYFDIGPVHNCLPYWKCPTKSNWRRLTESVTFNINCEMGDMQTFYSKRLVRVIGLNGLVQTALPCVVILEFGVFLAVVALSTSGSWKSASAQSRGWSQVFSLLCRKNYANIIANLVHLCLLVVIGNCFMEATGHSNPYLWESGMFLKWAQYYLLAPSILSIAIFCQQTADWGAARNSIKNVNAPLIDASREDAAKEDASTEDASTEDPSREDASTEDPSREDASKHAVLKGDTANNHTMSKANTGLGRRQTPTVRARHEPSRSDNLGQGSDGGNSQNPMLSIRGNAKDGVTVADEDDVAISFVPVSEDWRWQPVFGQIMVLVLTVSYCAYNSDDHRTEFVSFVLGLAVVCGIWSSIISCALLLRSVQCLYENLRPSRPSELSLHSL